MNLYMVVLVFAYVFYVSLESFGTLSRYSGYSENAVSIGLSLQNQVLSLNRFLGFAIAPAIGFFVDTGAEKSDILAVAVIGTFGGGVSLLFVYLKWNYFSGFLSNLIRCLKLEGYSVKSFLKLGLSRRVAKGDVGIAVKRQLIFKKNFVIAQMLTTGLAMPSVFVLNILAITYSNYSSTILQMTTLISGFGNLILNFYTIPLISVQESREIELEEMEVIYRSVYLGKIVGIVVLSPLVITIGYLI